MRLGSDGKRHCRARLAMQCNEAAVAFQQMRSSFEDTNDFQAHSSVSCWTGACRNTIDEVVCLREQWFRNLQVGGNDITGAVGQLVLSKGVGGIQRNAAVIEFD